MIRITQLKLQVGHSREDLLEKAARTLRVSPNDIASLDIWRQSLDARKKPELFYVYTVDIQLVSPEREKGLVRRIGKTQVALHRAFLRVNAGPPWILSFAFGKRHGGGQTKKSRRSFLGDRKAGSPFQRAVWRGRGRNLFGWKTEYVSEGSRRTKPACAGNIPGIRR